MTLGKSIELWMRIQLGFFLSFSTEPDSCFMVTDKAGYALGTIMLTVYLHSESSNDIFTHMDRAYMTVRLVVTKTRS